MHCDSHLKIGNLLAECGQCWLNLGSTPVELAPNPASIATALLQEMPSSRNRPEDTPSETTLRQHRPDVHCNPNLKN